MRFSPGDVIVERGIFNGSLVFARPQRVVSHEGDVLAMYLPVGTRYFGIQPKDRETAFDELRRGELRWGENTWHSHNVLTLVRPDDPYSIMGFWNEEGRFVAWYANLQEPLRWTPTGYDALDHTLDLIIGEDLATWMWKDEHELAMSVELGLHTQGAADAIRRNGEAVIEMIERRETWWDDWRSFEPDPSWPVPVFPDGWDVVTPS